MLTDKEVEAINAWLEKGFEIEIFQTNNGVLKIKRVTKKAIIVK